MATSPNYGWLEPDNTDLVKNGALAIRTLGNAIDTTMATMTPKSTVTAKGDLVTATAASTPANLAVGLNGSVLVADSSNTTGLRWTNTPSASNPVLNSAMQVAQRGTSAVTLNAAAFSYPVDRWFACRNAGTSGATAQQISSIGLTGFNNALRIQRTAGDTSTTRLYMGQSFETVNSIPYAGQSVTLSFYARAGANLSSNLAIRLFTGTGTDQSGLGSAWTGTATPISQSQSLTTTWTRYQFTATLATTATQLQTFFFIDPTGTAGAADYFDITGVQIDIGSVALPFRTAGVTYQQELAMCQRYYESTLGGLTAVTNMVGGTVMGADTGSAIYRALYIPYKVTKRGTPTVTLYDGAGTSGKISTVSSATLTPTNGITGTADNIGVDNYRVYWLTTNGGANWNHVVSAEL